MVKIEVAKIDVDCCQNCDYANAEFLKIEEMKITKNFVRWFCEHTQVMRDVYPDNVCEFFEW